MTLVPQSNESKRDVWFQLVDMNGRPYMRTGFGQVCVSPSADYVDFQKAVKAEYTNKLSSVDAGDLRIFKNRAAFDAKEMLLDLQDCGKTRDDMLMVLVPLVTLTVRRGNQSIPISCSIFRTIGQLIQDVKTSFGFPAGNIQLHTTVDRPPLPIELRLLDLWNQGGFDKHSLIVSDQDDVFTVKNSVDEEAESAFAAYKEVAARIVAHRSMECDFVVEALKLMPQTSFAYIGGSSGVGKTQMGITLLSQKQHDFGRVIYIHSSPYIGVNNQSIYTRFRAVSELMQECALKDLKGLEDDVPILGIYAYSTNELQSRTLYLYGFLIWALDHYLDCLPEGETIVILPCRYVDVKDFVAHNFLGVTPLVILDEFLPNETLLPGAIRDFVYLLIRNAILAVEWKVAVMGTQSTATKDLTSDLCYSSRKGDSRHTWCTILLQLPKFVPPADRGIMKDSLVANLLSSSRPWFATLFLQNWKSGNPNLNAAELLEIAREIGLTILDDKGISKHHGGRRGQVCQFISAYYHATDDVMVHRHFAVFSDVPSCLEVDIDMNILAVKQLTGNTPSNPSGESANSQTGSPLVGHEWKRESRLPIPQENILLHLCLSGIPGVNTVFDDQGQPTHFQGAVDQLMKASSSASTPHKILELNPTQRTNNGLELEMASAGSICKASHAHGYGGSTAAQFIKSVFYELTGIHLKISLAPIANLKFLKEYRVGFLSPPNAYWPEFLLQCPGSLFVNCARTGNPSRLDFAAKDAHFVFPLNNSDDEKMSDVSDLDEEEEESKKLKRNSCDKSKDTKLTANLKMKDLKASARMFEILKNIPEGIKFQLVVVETLADEFFGDRGNKKPSKITQQFLEQFPGVYASKCTFYCLNSKGELATSIPGIPNATDPRGLVLFIELKSKSKEVQ